MKITIINSKGYWKNAWVSSHEDLQILVNVLERNDIEVSVFEVDGLPVLKKILNHKIDDSLIWPNAYYVDKMPGSKEKVWLTNLLETNGFPFIGSGSQTLHNVLHKDICQFILRQHGIPVPNFAVIPAKHFEQIPSIVESSNLSYPAVVKLTAESGSMGMDDDALVQNQAEAICQIKKMMEKFQGNIIIEEFLPSDDLTIGYFSGRNGQPKLMTTWYRVLNKPGKTSIMGHKERFMKWGGIKKMVPVMDQDILKQAEELIPRICKILNIKDITRIDGRLDQNGQLKIFDVNGFPALVFPESVGVQQALVCYPEYPDYYVYDALINTIVHNAATRYQIKVPDKVADHNLFALKKTSTLLTI